MDDFCSITITKPSLNNEKNDRTMETKNYFFDQKTEITLLSLS